MNDLLVSLLLGSTLAFLLYTSRHLLAERFRRDVAWLEYAMWRMSPDPYDGTGPVAAYYAAVIVSLLLIIFVLPFKGILILVWIISSIAPPILIEGRWSKRRERINEQLPAAVLQMSSTVASGMSLAQATEHLANRAPAPISMEFQVMTNYWKMGSDFPATLEEAKRRLRLPNFNLFASALLINLRMGGDLTNTLERLAYSLESVEKMRRDVEVATSEGRTNIKVLAISPILMLGFICVIDFEAVGWLFTKPIGNIILAVAGGLIAIGLAWAWSIVNADV